VTVTHPFHPLHGQQLACVGQRYNPYGTTVLLQVGDGVWSLPRGWTDLVAPDPEVVVGEGRCPFRLRDLLDLAVVVEQLTARRSLERSDGV
jgi:hypothetical protein